MTVHDSEEVDQVRHQEVEGGEEIPKSFSFCEKRSQFAISLPSKFDDLRCRDGRGKDATCVRSCTYLHLPHLRR